jgi:hypothetical protein
MRNPGLYKKDGMVMKRVLDRSDGHWITSWAELGSGFIEKGKERKRIEDILASPILSYE